MEMHLPDLSEKIAVITGGGGAICGAMAEALAQQGVRVAIWDLSDKAAETIAERITSKGGNAVGLNCDVMDKAAINAALQATLDEYRGVDILINGAGGSRKEATTSPELSFFDILPEEIRRTIDLNYLSAVLPSQSVGRVFADQGHGVILNIASIAGLLPLSRSLAYSNGKAAVINFTQWLAVHMAKEYSPKIRVNALAPGFVLTDQNRFLLVDESGEFTERGQHVIGEVPLRRYGEPHDMAGTALWLVSDAAAFVTGAVIPVDGGYMAYSGV